MLALGSDLSAELDAARSRRATASVDWLRTAAPGRRRLGASVEVADFRQTVDALRTWELHRAAGLVVGATGPAEPGATVVLGLRLGPVLVVAPCRVVDVTSGPDRVSFTYVTLQGHPERGVQEFACVSTPIGARFEMSAASEPSSWAGRLAYPAVAAVQDRMWRRYLRAAADLR
jgi:uncharacterized protein (UPF0548 family)